MDETNLVYTVDLKQDGGKDGSVNEAPSYTYAFQLQGYDLHNASPLMQRANGSYSPAKIGLARLNGCEVELVWCDEAPVSTGS